VRVPKEEERRRRRRQRLGVATVEMGGDEPEPGRGHISRGGLGVAVSAVFRVDHVVFVLVVTFQKEGPMASRKVEIFDSKPFAASLYDGGLGVHVPAALTLEMRLVVNVEEH
jgi:hypothetical protein